MLTNSRKMIVLLIFHAVWGIALWLSISKYGLGVSTDSTSYLFSGANWIQGNGLVDYSGAQYIYWPPLYPMLIGFLHAAGLSAFASAHAIQFAGYTLLAYFSSVFFLKLFKDDFLFAFIGIFLLATGSIVVPSFHMVGTDYLFSIFPVVFVLLINAYAEKQKWTTLTLIGLTVSLAMLTRYLGYALVLTALSLFSVTQTVQPSSGFYPAHGSAFSQFPRSFGCCKHGWQRLARAGLRFRSRNIFRNSPLG